MTVSFSVPSTVIPFEVTRTLNSKAEGFSTDEITNGEIAKNVPFAVPNDPFPQKLLSWYVDTEAAGTYSVQVVNQIGLVINDELIVGQVAFKQVNDVSAGQLENSLNPIETKVAGMETVVKLLQP